MSFATVFSLYFSSNQRKSTRIFQCTVRKTTPRAHFVSSGRNIGKSFKLRRSLQLLKTWSLWSLMINALRSIVVILKIVDSSINRSFVTRRSCELCVIFACFLSSKVYNLNECVFLPAYRVWSMKRWCIFFKILSGLYKTSVQILPGYLWWNTRETVETL